MTLSNCDSNESANCEPGESEDSDGQTHPDVTSVIGPVPVHIPLKFYYRKYMLKKNGDDDDKGEKYGDAKKMTMMARQLSLLCGLRGVVMRLSPVTTVTTMR